MKTSKKNKLAKYNIAKVVIAVHSTSEYFNHASIFFRDAFNSTFVELRAQRHRMDMPDRLSSALYAPKPKDYERPEAPFDFGNTPFTGFYSLKVEDVRQSDDFDYVKFERVSKLLKTLRVAHTVDEMPSEQTKPCKLARLVWVLEQVLHTPIEFVLTMSGVPGEFTPYSIPYSYIGKSYAYWASQRGEEPLAQHCPKCGGVIGLLHERPTPDLCGVCFEELKAKEELKKYRCSKCGELSKSGVRYNGIPVCTACVNKSVEARP